jgi:hypothetical protein
LMQICILVVLLWSVFFFFWVHINFFCMYSTVHNWSSPSAYCNKWWCWVLVNLCADFLLNYSFLHFVNLLV